MTQKEIKQVAVKAEADFRALVPSISIPYPPVEVCTNNTFGEKLDKIADRIDADPIFLDEYRGPVKLIHGNKGDAIIVVNARDLSELRLRMHYLHELGKFFLLATEGEEFSDYAAELYELPYEEEELPAPFMGNEELSLPGWGKPIFTNQSGLSDDEEDDEDDDAEERRHCNHG